MKYRSIPALSSAILLAGCFLEPQPETSTVNVDCTTAVGFDDKILCAHNSVRSGTLNPQPSPALQMLAWSDDLAETAQAYANQCIWAHNANRGNGFNVQIGENLYAQTNEPENEDAVVNWAAESVDFDYDLNTCEPGKACGHYTQVVWRETTEVGCAIQFCPSLEHLPTWTEGGHIVVCNYAPAGNYIGQQPY